MKKKNYVAVIEKSKTGFSGYCPDMPGLIVTGKTRAEVKRLLVEGIVILLDEYKRDGVTIPAIKTTVEVLEVDVAV